MSWFKPVCIFLAVFSVVRVSNASTAVELIHNPFSYLEQNSPSPSQKISTKAPLVNKVTWRPELSATIVAGGLSVANVTGKIIRIGEKLDGFTLVKVTSQTATFEKNKSRVVLKMNPKR